MNNFIVSNNVEMEEEFDEEEKMIPWSRFLLCIWQLFLLKLVKEMMLIIRRICRVQ